MKLIIIFSRNNNKKKTLGNYKKIPLRLMYMSTYMEVWMSFGEFKNTHFIIDNIHHFTNHGFES